MKVQNKFTSKIRLRLFFLKFKIRNSKQIRTPKNAGPISLGCAHFEHSRIRISNLFRILNFGNCQHFGRRLSFQSSNSTAKVRLLLTMEVPDSFYGVGENVCRDLYIQSLKEIPPDVVEAIRQAASRETKEVAKRIFSHYLQSIELGRTQNMIVCQDTGIPIYWVNIGGKLRLDGACLNEAIIRGTERATREHPLRSSIVSPLK